MDELGSSAGIKAKDTEIERKFLVRETPNLDGAKGDEVVQGYLAVDRDGTEVRLRRIGDCYFETVKTGSGLRRGEYETAITEEQFTVLWPATEGRRLEKTRYELEFLGHTLYLDIYRGSLNGLEVAEVEFDSEGEGSLFAPPEWFGKEITEDSAYKNRNLATKGMPEGERLSG